MAVAAQKSRVIVGHTNAATEAMRVGFQHTRTMLARTALADTSYVYIPGKATSTLNLDLMFQDSTFSLWNAHHSAANVPVTVFPAGETVANTLRVAWMANTIQEQWEVKSAADGAVDVGAQYATTGPLSFGQTLVASSSPLTATGDGTAVDGGAASSNGGYAHLHVSAASGAGRTLDVDIEDSADGSTGWASIGSFTQTAIISSQRITIAAGTTVKRYLRASYTIAGTTPSFTTTVAFARA